MFLSKFNEFIPKSYLYLRKNYKLSTFKKDLLAGITVGIIALPLAMAFAIASGVPPERGLYTAVVAGFLISAFGGSRVQIGGPTGAFVVIVYGIIQRTGYDGLCLSMGVAAIILILLGIFRVGSWIKYVPYPLITGFTSGIALLIFSTQIKDFFGLKMGIAPAGFAEKWVCYFRAFPTFDPLTLSVAAGTLGAIILIRRFLPSLPWGIGAIAIATILCALFQVPIEIIEARFGEIPRNLPTPTMPSFVLIQGHFKEILVDGLLIAFLGGIESLLSAVIGDGMIGGRHRSNCELIAQGIANFGSAIFGGIPATGALARTAANVKNGAQTPVAGMIHALTLFLILYCLSLVVSQIPLAALSAVLVMVSWNMSEVSHFIRLLKAPIGDRIILLTAFILTVFIDLTVAISVGMVLASFVFMYRMSRMSRAVPLSRVFQENDEDFPELKDPENISKKKVPKGIEVYEIHGALFFGAANMLRDILNDITTTPKIFILRIRSVPMVDASGMYGIEEFFRQCSEKNTILLLSGVHDQIRQDLKKFGLIDLIGEQRIFPNIDAALAKASTLLPQ